MRRTEEAAVERVGPRVIGTLNRFGEPAGFRFAQPGAAMAANVVIRPSLARLIAEHDDAFARNVDHEIIARRGERRVAADTDPMTGEDALLLEGEHIRRRVVAARQGARPLLIAFDRLQE